MKRSPTPLAVLAILAASASFGQEFAGMDDLPGQISGIRNLVQRQAALIPQAPPPPAKNHEMGSSGKRGKTKAPVAAEMAPVEAAGVPNVSAYQVRGIDISHFQKEVDWSKVKTDGFSFIYIKATEGASTTDERFTDNWAGARRVGLARGAYHFYNFCRSGSAQADNFIKTVPVDAADLPPTIDLEESEDCKTMPAKAAFRKDLAAFVAKVQSAYGHSPLIYVNYAIYDKYFNGENDSYRVWIADTDHSSPALPDNASWTMWQYDWHGQAAGIGEVDLDVFNGTPQMFAALPLDNSIMVADVTEPR